MRNTQKIIKHIAMAFAIFLVFNIISSIMLGVMAMGNIFSDNTGSTKKLEALNLSTDAVVLDIDVSSANVIIQAGDTFHIETNSEDIKSRQNGNQLIIEEKNNNWFFNFDNRKLVVFIPKEYIFDGVSIDAGAGKVTIDSLQTKKLYINQGAGKVTIQHLDVSEQAEIEGGAGKMSIKDGIVNNLDMKIGIGKLSLKAILDGTSKIDCGIGAVDIALLGAAEDYQIEASKGIGELNVNGLSKNGDTYGSGDKFIIVNGGIGSIQVDLIDK